jgi:CBS domain-containing protein
MRRTGKGGAMSATQIEIHTPVSKLMTRDFLAVAPWDTLGEAVESMNERGTGSALVFDYGRLVGILTSRDVLRAVAGRTHSSEARVRDWMTADPRVVRVETPAEEAALIMVEQGCHQLPVVEDGHPVGVVGMRAVVSETIEPVLD